MSKPIFLLCPGAAKSSTTFLSEILIQNKVFHYGYAKECSYLDFVFYGENNLPKYYIGHPGYLEKISKNSEYSYNDFDNFCKNYTIENYYKYYLDVYNQTQFVGGVCDFSQSYNLLPENFLNEVKQELEKFFVVKCILLFRDPIRRLFSFSNMWCPNNAIGFFYENVMQDTLSFSANYYQNVIEKFENIFLPENIFISSMEEMYLYNTFKSFDKFLSISNLKLNRINVSRYNSYSKPYKQNLSEDDINFAKKKLYGNYEYWKNKFRSLPSKWHQVV